MSRNRAIGQALETLADLLDFKGENVFKLRAYRKAARVLRGLKEDVAVLARERRLRSLPGIGEAIEKKIGQHLETGEIEALNKAMADVPEAVRRIIHDSHAGPAAVARRIRIVPEERMTRALDRGIRAGLCVCCPAHREIFSRTRAWHGSVPTWTVVLEQGSRVIAHAGIVERRIRVARERLSIAGIQNVFVIPEHRGQALSESVVEVAMYEAQNRQLDCGLLFCIPELERFYVRQGWRRLPDVPITRVDETGRECPLPGKNVAMYFPLALETFPIGAVHLQGNDW